ncbi:hypothetical protein TrVE_jg13098 [Triparma verrucosa]|uniref:Uncharacterized protein n=1 Tax=Triparma verrucosa TaxID=1606542 RepID=A0A9W7ETM8_9STRA|nr:hypothetical protein TrVE_jg13098 [Triparma verrucosa]
MAIKDDDTSESTSKTKTNPNSDIEAQTINPMSKESESLGDVALTNFHEKVEEGADTAQTKILGAVDKATGGGIGQSKVKEPDKGRATFDILVQCCCTLAAFYQYWTSPTVNYLGIHPFSDHVSYECKAIYFTSVVMYKPATLSLWVVLMATSHLTYWRRVKSIPLKKQKNIDLGIPELPSNYLSAAIVWTTFFLYFCWLVVAVYFLPLLFLFFPVTLGLLYGVPVGLMEIPIMAIKMFCKWRDIKGVDTSLLQMKVMAAATVVTVVCAMGFKAFYVTPDPELWLAVLEDEVDELIKEVGESLLILKQILVLDFNFDISLSLGWPSKLEFPEQFPLLASAGLLGTQYLSVAFLFFYRRWKIEKWGEEWADNPGGLNRKVETAFEFLTLRVSAGVVAEAKRKNDDRLVAPIERKIEQKRTGLHRASLGRDRQGSELKRAEKKAEESDTALVELKKKKAGIEADHIYMTTLKNFLINNPDLKELDLSGSIFLEGVPEELSSMKELKHVNFNGCESLNGTVVLPAGVDNLPEEAFRGCERLDGFKMLAPIVDIKDIGENAFLGCKQLLRGNGHEEESYNQQVVIQSLRKKGMLKVRSNFKFTDENIKEKVKLWLKDEKACQEKCGHIMTWDVSEVTNMSELFKDATAFNEDLSYWDVSKVTKMDSMFESAGSFKGKGIGKWNVSNVTSMVKAFKDTLAFREEGIGGWKVDNVELMNDIFEGAALDLEKVEGWKMEEKFGHSFKTNESLKAATGS